MLHALVVLSILLFLSCLSIWATSYTRTGLGMLQLESVGSRENAIHLPTCPIPNSHSLLTYVSETT